MKIGLLGLLWVIFGVVSVSCWAKLDFLRESYTPLWVCSGQKCTKLLDFLMFFKLNFWVTENFELWAKIVKRKCSQLLIACSIWNSSLSSNMMPSFNISQKPTKVNSILNHVLSLSEGLYTNLQFLESTQISFNSPLLDRQTIALTSLLSSEIEMIRAYSKQPSLFTLFCPLLTKMISPSFGSKPSTFHFVGKYFPDCIKRRYSSCILLIYSWWWEYFAAMLSSADHCWTSKLGKTKWLAHRYWFGLINPMGRQLMW